ncbi:hypothetical protein [Corallococcus sicarius]|uniref:hypothetical protein n=1 Tax=Corallococcus sicarius TaxID=2316726 RepID=UPI0011C3697B|nr:hypothetical protein [Corallococcus sicarius]
MSPLDEIDVHFERLIISGGPGRKSSKGAFLDLVRKVRKAKVSGCPVDVYITDRYVFADASAGQQVGGYSSLIDYLAALELKRESAFNLHLPSWPARSELQKRRDDDLSEAQRIVLRLVGEHFPNAAIQALHQQVRFHDRLYVVRDERSGLSGVFGPSLNGLHDEDIALIGELDDDDLLKRLDGLLTR